MKLIITTIVPDDQPLRSTLGRALKALLRRYRIRCIDIREEPEVPKQSKGLEVLKEKES